MVPRNSGVGERNSMRVDKGIKRRNLCKIFKARTVVGRGGVRAAM